jgi:hypothetical protein
MSNEHWPADGRKLSAGQLTAFVMLPPPKYAEPQGSATPDGPATHLLLPTRHLHAQTAILRMLCRQTMIDGVHFGLGVYTGFSEVIFLPSLTINVRKGRFNYVKWTPARRRPQANRNRSNAGSMAFTAEEADRGPAARG